MTTHSSTRRERYVRDAVHAINYARGEKTTRFTYLDDPITLLHRRGIAPGGTVVA